MQNRSRLVKKIVTLKTTTTIKIIIQPGNSIAPFNPITWEAEAGGCLSSRPAWSRIARDIQRQPV